MTEYVAFYNLVRPHQGIGQKTLIFRFPANHEGPIQRRDVLGGIVHDYSRKTV
jgi:hypothetical protein